MSARLRLALALALAAAIGVVAFLVLRPGPTSPERTAPVVIFVVLDTVRADRTSLCGYDVPTTQSLEDLVDDGASYTCDSHSPGTWTLPSHATFLTGVGLHEHRAGNGGGSQRMGWGGVTPLGPELPTLAEEMAAKGYQTLLLSGNPVISERMGLTRGFEHRAIGRTYPMMRNGRLAARLRGLLRVAQLNPARPLFAFVNIADAHAPWTAIPDWTGFLPERPALDVNPQRKRFEAGEMSDEEAEAYLAHLSDVYDYGVYRADRSLGLVLDVLREHGWLDQSYRLIVTSDHGEYLGEHDMIEHGRADLYEPVTRVPLVYYSTENQVELPAEVPTIVVHSLLLDGTLPDPLPPPFAGAFRQLGPAGNDVDACSSAKAAIWKQGAKLVADSGRVQRFDLAADPDELAPIAADDHPDSAELLQHCRELDDGYASRPALDAGIDTALRQQLRALGYLQGDDPTVEPSVAKKIPVTDRYHGTEVIDPYRWLENWDDPEVQAWSEAQNTYARSVLDGLAGVDGIRARITEIMHAGAVGYDNPVFRGGQLFILKRQPPKQQPFIVVMSSADEPKSARIVVDPNELDASGATSIDWFVPSSDGTLLAVSLSRGGDESGDVHVFDTRTGKQVYEVVPRVNGGTAGGDVAWLPDGTGFFYTRYPRGAERPEEDRNFYVQIYFHRLGTPAAEDRYELGKAFPRIAEIRMEMDARSGRLLATVQKGDGGEFAHFLRSKGGAWTQFSEFGDKTVVAVFGPRDDVYVVSTKGAPRGRILRMPIAKLDVTRAKPVVEQGKDTIVVDFWGTPTVVPTDSRLYVTYQLGGPSEIRAFDLDGKPRPAPRQLPVSAVGDVTPIGAGAILFENQSYLEPPAWFRFDPKADKTHKTALRTEWPVDLSDVEVVREYATSKDGTKVPVNILVPKALDRNRAHPAVAYGYGGYGYSLKPWFNPNLAVLLDAGIIYAVANLRGGGEYGEEWHRQGNLTNKQNVFDDFKAVIDHLVSRGYSSNDQLAIMGGSNGGLLMGATMVQNPGIAKAVVSRVGLYDMLRVELSPNGAFNVTEFGTVQDPDQFRALYAYSPYHNVVDGAPYPATLFLTGQNDPRVDPMQSRKMTARLQEATKSDAPILLRTSADSGHGGNASLDERVEQYVDVYAFLLDQLGRRPKR